MSVPGSHHNGMSAVMLLRTMIQERQELFLQDLQIKQFQKTFESFHHLSLPIATTLLNAIHPIMKIRGNFKVYYLFYFFEKFRLFFFICDL